MNCGASSKTPTREAPAKCCTLSMACFAGRSPTMARLSFPKRRSFKCRLGRSLKFSLARQERIYEGKGKCKKNKRGPSPCRRLRGKAQDDGAFYFCSRHCREIMNCGAISKTPTEKRPQNAARRLRHVSLGEALRWLACLSRSVARSNAASAAV